MKVEAVLNRKGREVKTVGPSATLATVAQRLRFDRIGALVMADGDKLLGMSSERDVVHAFVADRERAADVAEAMARNVITCDPDESLTRVLGLMTRHHVRHNPVMQDGQLLGLISIGDVVKHQLEMEAAAPRDSYIAGH